MQQFAKLFGSTKSILLTPILICCGGIILQSRTKAHTFGTYILQSKTKALKQVYFSTTTVQKKAGT